jgi:DNA repair exonuclease SbcCD nuclease subunit
MPHWPFRFIHAADFQLHRPVTGITEVPEHLRELLLEAAYRAAVRVFEAALTEESDFVLLAGNLLDPEATGPHGPLTLVEQFGRLAERGIAVYWVGGQCDPPEVWPAVYHLPENVHVFPAGRPVEILHQREGEPIARIVGASREGGIKPTPRAQEGGINPTVLGREGGINPTLQQQEEHFQPAFFNPDPTGLFTIGLANGLAEAETLASRGIDYWALGGGGRQTLFQTPHTAHYPGSPQGRQPVDVGPHGCTSLHVDAERRLQSQLITTDVLRWHTERLVIDPGTTRNELESRLRQRMVAAIGSAPGTALLVSWTVAGSGPLLGQLRRGSLAADLLALLRKEFGQAKPAAWSTALEVEAGAVLNPEWYEQKTIRGDFLRAVRQYQMDPAQGLNLEAFLGQPYASGETAALAAASDPAVRERVLSEAALLGVDLLSGEEPQA